MIAWIALAGLTVLGTALWTSYVLNARRGEREQAEYHAKRRAIIEDIRSGRARVVVSRLDGTIEVREGRQDE